MSVSDPRPLRTGMARSLLREIAARLDTLARTGESHALDLRSLPMTPGDRDELEQALGRGEVSATLEAAGRSEVWETRHAGVWWLRHYGGDGRIATEVIEIATVPGILAAHPADMRAAAAALRDDFDQTPPSETETEHG